MTTIHKLTAVPGQPKALRTLVSDARQPGVYAFSGSYRGAVRYGLVPTLGGIIRWVDEATAEREAKLLMDDAAQEADAELTAAASPAQAPSSVPEAEIPEGDSAGAVCNLGALADAIAFASGLLADGTPNTKLARGVLIRGSALPIALGGGRESEDWSVISEPVYVDRTPKSFVERIVAAVKALTGGGFGKPIVGERVEVGVSFTREDTEAPIALRGLRATPGDNRDRLNPLDWASLDGRIVYTECFSSGSLRRAGATGWGWNRDNCVVGLLFEIPEVAGYRAGGRILHSHDGSSAFEVRASVTVEGRQLYAPAPFRRKLTLGAAQDIDDAKEKVFNGLVNEAKALAAALDAAKTIDAESAAVLVASKVLDVDAEKLSETIERLHAHAARFSPSLGGARYVLAAGEAITDTDRPFVLAAYTFGVASERTSKALQVLASEAAKRAADVATAKALAEQVNEASNRLPTLEGDGGAAITVRKGAILSALRATALFPRDMSRDMDELGDRSAVKQTPARLLALRAVIGTMARDNRALSADWWTDHAVNALQTLITETMESITKGAPAGASSEATGVAS